jgi:signal transduction histidine kinase
MALALVATIGRRERRLARALAAAAAEEARLRAVAEQRREDLARISASKGRLVRGFTHDVKNPIGAADGYLQLVEDGITGPVTERQLASIRRARRAIHSALALIGDLLEVARAESGHLEVEHVPVDLAATAMDVAEDYRAQAEAKGLALRVETAAVPLVDTDPARVRQVIGNLVSNAVKYTPTGCVTVRVVEYVGRRADDPDHAVQVEVEDTGPGIPEEKRRLLFHEFTRLDPTAAPGVGLGLAMSHRIVEALGGRLHVGGEPGRGSTFILSLPVRSVRERAGIGDGTARATAAS